MKTQVKLLAALILTGFSAGASADCMDGPRSATEREANYFNQVFSTLKGTLPAAPSGWTLAPVRDEHVNRFFCKGDREGDFAVRVTASYTYHIPKEESDRIYAEFRNVQKEMDALNQLPPDVAKERQGWLDKMSEANRAANRTEKEGNKTQARQLSNEADGYSEKGREVRDRYRASVEPQLAQLQAKQKTLNYQDTTVNVSVVANEHDAKPMDRTTSSELTFGKAPAAKTTALKAQAIRVVVTGDAPKRDEILNAIDRDKLARLVQ